MMLSDTLSNLDKLCNQGKYSKYQLSDFRSRLFGWSRARAIELKKLRSFGSGSIIKFLIIIINHNFWGEKIKMFIYWLILVVALFVCIVCMYVCLCFVLRFCT